MTFNKVGVFLLVNAPAYTVEGCIIQENLIQHRVKNGTPFII